MLTVYPDVQERRSAAAGVALLLAAVPLLAAGAGLRSVRAHLSGSSHPHSAAEAGISAPLLAAVDDGDDDAFYSARPHRGVTSEDAGDYVFKPHVPSPHSDLRFPDEQTPPPLLGPERKRRSIDRHFDGCSSVSDGSSDGGGGSGSGERDSLSPAAMAATAEFWLLLAEFGVAIGCGLALLNNLGQLVVALGGPEGGQVGCLSDFRRGICRCLLLYTCTTFAVVLHQPLCPSSARQQSFCFPAACWLPS